MTRLNGLESPFWLETRGRLAGAPRRVLAGFAIIDAGPGEHAEARLTVPARSFARFDEGLSQ